MRIPAWVYLGMWFLYQLVNAHYAIVTPDTGGGVAFSAHVGGFAFGLIATALLTGAGRVEPNAPPQRPALGAL